MPVNVEFTPEFKRNIRALTRKYRHIRDDVDPLIIDLQNGQLPGAQVTGTGYPIVKVVFQIGIYAKAKAGAIT